MRRRTVTALLAVPLLAVAGVAGLAGLAGLAGRAWSLGHDGELLATAAPRWPTVCPEHWQAQDGARARQYVNLTLFGMEPAVDLLVDPLHTRLTVLGAHRRHDADGMSANILPRFWCVFARDGPGAEVSTTTSDIGGPEDSHFGIFLRSCAIPDAARALLDDGEAVSVTFVHPYYEGGGRTAAVRVQPHPERCPAAVRRRLALPPSPPRVRPDPPVGAPAADTAPSLAPPHARALVACTMIRSADATAELVEWIEYHRMQAYDHFYIYHHHNAGPPGRSARPSTAGAGGITVAEDADDGDAAVQRAFLALLRGYIDDGIVTVVDWPRPDPAEQPMLAGDRRMQQIVANNHCVHMFGTLAEWTHVFDMDEFVLPLTPGRTVLETLRSLRQRGAIQHIASLRMWLFRDTTNANPNSTTDAAPSPVATSRRHRDAAGDSTPLLRSQTFVYRNALPFPNSRNKVIVHADAVGTQSMHSVTAPHGATTHYPEADLRLCHLRREPWPDDGMPEFVSTTAQLTLDAGLHRYGAALQARVDAYLDRA